MRFIYCPGARGHVPLWAYVKAIRFAKAHPDQLFTNGISSWWPTRGAEVMKQFRASIHARINDGIPYTELDSDDD